MERKSGVKNQNFMHKTINVRLHLPIKKYVLICFSGRDDLFALQFVDCLN